MFPSHGEWGEKTEFKEGPGLLLGKGLAAGVREGRTMNSGKKEVACFVSQTKILGIWFGVYPAYTTWLGIKQDQEPQ